MTTVVASKNNGGLGFNMWATVVNRDGEVCVVVFTGSQRGNQWPGSRVISAQKANTANAFSLPGLALSTVNLHSAVQPGGTLFGLQHSNPVDTTVAYGGNPASYGQPNDPMVGHKIGGVNVFGGGLALYKPGKVLVGAIGVSGDTSCTDHIVAWKVRHKLNLDDVPAGVAKGAPNPSAGTDNIIHDIALNATGHPVSASGFGHPTCDQTATDIANNLPATNLWALLLDSGKWHQGVGCVQAPLGGSPGFLPAASRDRVSTQNCGDFCGDLTDNSAHLESTPYL